MLRSCNNPSNGIQITSPLWLSICNTVDAEESQREGGRSDGGFKMQCQNPDLQEKIL